MLWIETAMRLEERGSTAAGVSFWIAVWLTSSAAIACQSARPAHALPAPDAAAGNMPIFFGDDIHPNETCAGPGPDAGAALDARAAFDSADPLCATAVPAVSFERDVARLVGCTGEICHARWTYDTLVNQSSSACCDHRALVAPGYPSTSHLVQALRGTSPCVPRMPLGGQLSDSDIATVIAWICQGAPDN
jgi:hypothetical protein